MSDPIILPISDTARLKFYPKTLDGNYNFHIERHHCYNDGKFSMWYSWGQLYIPTSEIKGFIAAVSRLEKLLILK